jgi:hypothetical protein
VRQSEVRYRALHIDASTVALAIIFTYIDGTADASRQEGSTNDHEGHNKLDRSTYLSLDASILSFLVMPVAFQEFISGLVNSSIALDSHFDLCVLSRGVMGYEKEWGEGQTSLGSVDLRTKREQNSLF